VTDEKGWYKNHWRRILVDMHIPDWDSEFLSMLDAEKYVDMMEAAGATGAMVYANSHVGLCMYPTKVGRMHNGLKGRDFFGRVTELCHKRGIAVVAYYSLIFNNVAYIEHPDWRIVFHKWLPQGGEHAPGRYGTCCPNSPYRDFAIAQTEEICTTYDPEGIFFDMTFWPNPCYCSHCQNRYKKECGQEIPRLINWNDGKWVRFQRARERWIDEFASVMTQKVHDVNPSMTVTHQFATIMGGWQQAVPFSIAEHSDYLSGDFYGESIQQSVVCKAFQNLSAKKPFEFHTSRCLDLTDHVTMKSTARMKTQAFMAPAHGSAFMFIDAIDPRGTLNPGTYERIRSIFDAMASYEKQLGGTLCADVAVYFSHESKFNPACNNTPIEKLMEQDNRMPHAEALTGACRSLQEAHIPFTVIAKKNLDELARYQVLVLPDVLVMDDTEAYAVRKFVKAGGGLYASFRTATGRPDGNPPDGCMLGDVLGVSLQKEEYAALTFLTPTDKRLGDWISPQDHMIHPRGQATIKDCSGEILAVRSCPYTDPCKGDVFGKTFSSIHSNPPKPGGTEPAILFNTFGKGRVIYAAGALEAVDYDVNRRVFANLIKMLLQRPTWFAADDLHHSIEITLFNQPRRKRMLASLVQTNPELTGVPMAVKFCVRVPEGFSAGRLKMLPDNKVMEYDFDDNYVTVTPSDFDTFAMIALEYARGK